MGSDKRGVSTDALETLGMLIGENEKRDAIHLAVEPVVAKERLLPGADIRIDQQGKAYGCDPKDGLGIVDPFLPVEVQEGQRFWLVVYPRQITSLRHVWSHPNFEDPEIQLPLKAQSQAWVRNFMKERDISGYGDFDAYEYLLSAAVKNSGNDELFLGIDAYGEIPDEFWDHIEILTGKKIEERNRAKHFSCAC